MPTYVYHCDKCGVQFERFQSIKEAPLQLCVCGQEGSVRRVFQPVGIVFKGSGWYITDSRKSSSATITDTSSPAESTHSAKSTDTPVASSTPSDSSTTTSSE